MFKLIVSIIFIINILFASNNKECKVDGIIAPLWVCNNIQNHDYDYDIIVVGMAENDNFNIPTIKKLAIADARIQIAEILEVQVESKLYMKKKSHNDKFEDFTSDTIHTKSFQKIQNYKLLKFWEHPNKNIVYVLVGYKYKGIK